MMKLAKVQRIFPTILVGLLFCGLGLLWPESEYRRPLTVAVAIWPGSEGLILAESDFDLSEQRLNLVEMSWSSAVMGAFRRRVVDGAVVTLAEMMRLEAEGFKPRAVLVLGESRGSDAVLGRTEVSSMADLRGKRIGVELKTSGEHLLFRALAAHGMTMKDVRIVPLNVAETEVAFEYNELDAVVTSDPWRTRILGKGAKALYDSNQVGLEMSRVLVVHEEALLTYQEELKSLVSACLEKNAELASDQVGDFMQTILRREGLELSQWRELKGMVHFPDRKENLRLMEPSSEGLEQSMAGMLDEGLGVQELKTGVLLYSNFLKEQE
jgi:NitT/TauT family transport system substrate-binding protein